MCIGSEKTKKKKVEQTGAFFFHAGVSKQFRYEAQNIQCSEKVNSLPLERIIAISRPDVC